MEVHQTHPLMLLGAIASITRTLIENYERAVFMTGGSAAPELQEFESKVFPKVEQEAKARKAKVPHPYAAFMSMQAAMKFERKQLLNALVACAEANWRSRAAPAAPTGS